MKDFVSFIKNYSTRDFIYFFSEISIELYKNQQNKSEDELKCSITFPLNAILHGFIHRQVQVMLSAWDIQNMAYVSIVSANDYRKEITVFYRSLQNRKHFIGCQKFIYRTAGTFQNYSGIGGRITLSTV